MNNRFFIQSPYLRAEKKFPKEAEELSLELNRSYLEIAQKVNFRVIGSYGINVVSVTGEQWFFSSQPRQTLRKVFEVNGSNPINHNINVEQIEGFTRVWGMFYDLTNWYPLPYVNPTATEQIGLHISPTQIIITQGGSAPTIEQGFVVLEWLSLSPTVNFQG